MDNIILTDFLTLTAIALTAALILYFVSQKFKVDEDPRIADIEAMLPQANCGACGRAGCHDFAVACTKCTPQGFTKLYCPVGGQKVMNNVAAYLGMEAAAKEDTVAVLRCNGSCQNAPTKIDYNGVQFCRIANTISSGQSGCPDGCLRLGDCVKVCKFGALSLNPQTGLPQVDADKCTSCGACVGVCPRHLFEIRPKSLNNEIVYIACRNRQKGAIARKNCSAACIGCMKCAKICPEIKIEDNLSYIPTDVKAAEFGAKLAEACPTGAIVYIQPKGQLHD